MIILRIKLDFDYDCGTPPTICKNDSYHFTVSDNMIKAGDLVYTFFIFSFTSYIMWEA